MKGLIITIFVVLCFIYFVVGMIAINSLNYNSNEPGPLILFLALYIVFGFATLIVLPNWAEEMSRQ